LHCQSFPLNSLEWNFLSILSKYQHEWKREVYWCANKIEREQYVFTVHECVWTIFCVHNKEHTIFTVHKWEQKILGYAWFDMFGQLNDK